DADGSPADIGVYGGPAEDLLDADRDGLSGPGDCDDDDVLTTTCPDDTGRDSGLPQETGTPQDTGTPQETGTPGSADPASGCGCASSGSGSLAVAIPMVVGLVRRRRQSCSFVPFRPEPS
ncbi:MAG: hypothetical protein KC656_15985, partial [Myxococcales bacterium]|nr:hypothetical protein [Myxococcales bacterium]